MWEIVPGKLWQGDIFDAAHSTADLVVTCSPESEVAADLGDLVGPRQGHLLVPFRDEPQLPAILPLLWATARFVNDAQLATLVHCTAGRNRSGLVIGLILATAGRIGRGQIVPYILARHPEALSNRIFRAYLDTL